MLHRHTLGTDAVVVALQDETGGYFLTAKSGKSALAIHLSGPAAARVRAELEDVPPDVSPRRPAAPKANWRALLSRMDAGKPLPGDADRLRELFHHLRYPL